MGRARVVAERVAPTVVDVARMAGVSIGTVSNVLNNPAIVTAPTRARVVEAIEVSGFIRNSNARSLATGTASSVALIVPDITNSVFVDMAKGAQAAADQVGLSLMIANADNDAHRQDRLLDAFAEARTTGILLAPMQGSWAGLKRVRDHGRPVVVLNFDDPDLDACTVLMDNEEGGRLAAEHLIGLGCRRLSFVGADDAFQPVRDRRRGVRAASAAIPAVSLQEIDVADVHQPGEGRRIGAAIADHWSRRDGPLGILAVTDTIAREVLAGILANRGIRVPDDIAVMGMDGNRMAWDTSLTLTTLALPGEAMGAEAIRLLAAELHDGHIHEHAVYPMHINPRQSTVRTGRAVRSRRTRPRG